MPVGKIRRLLSAIRFTLAACGAFLLLITFTPVVPWTASKLTQWGDANHGVMIVLGGSTVGDEGAAPLIGLDTYWRIVHVIYMWRQSHFQSILLSGAGSAETVKPMLLAAGIPENAIVVENRSTSTRENALFAKPILAALPGPYALFTSDYHTYRAVRSFQHIGLSVTGMACPDVMKRSNSYLGRWQCFLDVMGELGRIIHYRLRGWI